jgi:hypothetical protein
MILAILFFIVLLFGFVLLRGAPYLPTRGKDIVRVFDVLQATKKDVLVDLGAGDGALLKAAAKREIKAYGYELNPILVGVAWLRCLLLKPRPTVRLDDLWRVPLPKETTIVFTFLHTRFMEKFDFKMRQEVKRLGHPIAVVSYAFTIPNREPIKVVGALFFYSYKP